MKLIIWSIVMLILGIMVGIGLPNKFGTAYGVDNPYTGRHGIEIVTYPLFPGISIITNRTGKLTPQFGITTERRVVAMIDNWDEFCPLDHSNWKRVIR